VVGRVLREQLWRFDSSLGSKEDFMKTELIVGSLVTPRVGKDTVTSGFAKHAFLYPKIGSVWKREGSTVEYELVETATNPHWTYGRYGAKNAVALMNKAVGVEQQKKGWNPYWTSPIIVGDLNAITPSEWNKIGAVGLPWRWRFVRQMGATVSPHVKPIQKGELVTIDVDHSYWGRSYSERAYRYLGNGSCRVIDKAFKPRSKSGTHNSYVPGSVFAWKEEDIVRAVQIGSIWRKSSAKYGYAKYKLVLTADQPYSRGRVGITPAALRYKEPNVVALMNVKHDGNVTSANPFQTWGVKVENPHAITPEEWQEITRDGGPYEFVSLREEKPVRVNTYGDKEALPIMPISSGSFDNKLKKMGILEDVKKEYHKAEGIAKKKKRKKRKRKKGGIVMIKRYRINQGQLGGRVLESTRVSKCGSFVFFPHLDREVRVHTKHLTELTEANFVDTTSKGEEKAMSELRATAFGYVTAKNVKRIENLKRELLERTDTNVAEVTAIRQGTRLDRDKTPKVSWWTPERIALAIAIVLSILSMVV
jgi:hypothetical protein